MGLDSIWPFFVAQPIQLQAPFGIHIMLESLLCTGFKGFGTSSNESYQDYPYA